MQDYTPFSPEVLAEPSAAYAYLLNEAPVHRCESFDPPFYTLSRHADVAAALRDVETFSSEWGLGPRFMPPVGMLSDPPQHTFFRRLVQQAFTPGAVAALEPRIASLAASLLDEVTAGEAWDLHDEFAFPLPVIVIAEMLGAPAEDLDRFKRWSDVTVAALGAEDPTPYADELAALDAYLLAAIEERRRAPQADDLIARLVRAEQDGARLADEEVVSVITQLLVGGNEPTTSLITNAVWRLLERPERWAALVAEPALVDAALEESLRFDPPVLGLYRTTTRAVALHGVTIPANTKVMLHYGAANRDPAAFDDPDTFSLDRPEKRHLSFGLGVHFCLGAQLARLEASNALRALVRKFPELELVGPGERIAPFFLWGCKHLPVVAPGGG